MTYMYQAAFLCDQCGFARKQSMLDDGTAPQDITDDTSFDSDDFPVYIGNDTGESDSVDFCDSGKQCLNPETIEHQETFKIGKHLTGSLTDEGIKSLNEFIREVRTGKRTTNFELALRTFYTETFGDVIESSPYDEMTQDDFNQILESIVGRMSTSQLMSIPGIYEILSEELNNNVLTEWEMEQGINNDDD